MIVFPAIFFGNFHSVHGRRAAIKDDFPFISRTLWHGRRVSLRVPKVVPPYRIAIARAILKDAPIVLLDEATASVDPDNEHAIRQALSRVCAGKTVILIAHRPQTIGNRPIVTACPIAA